MNRTYTIDNMPLGWRHIWIVCVAALGQMIGTGVATVAGVIIPMLNIISHPELSTPVQGLIGAADLVGIAIGSSLFGRLIDRYGYLFFFRFCPSLVFVAAIVAVFVHSVPVLIVCLFIIGIGIGGEYSLDGDYISELMPASRRSQMVGWSKTASALGNIVFAGICWWIVADTRNAAMWPMLMWIVVGMSGLMILSRIYFFQSPKWLVEHGRVAEAKVAVKKLLGPDATLSPDFVNSVMAQRKQDSANGQAKAGRPSLLSFVRNNFDRVMITGVPWACEGLGVYGIGIFLPMLVMALGIEPAGGTGDPILHVASSVEITMWISCIILPGFILGIFLIGRKLYLPRIEWLGFFLSAVSLAVLMAAYWFKWSHWIAIAAFMCFELFLNMGPHLITFVLPPEIYPEKEKGFGAGLAATIGKIGAVVAVFVFPVLLKIGGAVLVLGVSVAVMLAGGVVTVAYARKVMPENKTTSIKNKISAGE